MIHLIESYPVSTAIFFLHVGKKHAKKTCKKPLAVEIGYEADPYLVRPLCCGIAQVMNSKMCVHNVTGQQ